MKLLVYLIGFFGLSLFFYYKNPIFVVIMLLIVSVMKFFIYKKEARVNADLFILGGLKTELQYTFYAAVFSVIVYTALLFLN